MFDKVLDLSWNNSSISSKLHQVLMQTVVDTAVMQGEVHFRTALCLKVTIVKCEREYRLNEGSQ